MADKPEAYAFKKKPTSREVEDFHTHSDRDASPKALHHTLGSQPNQAAPGNHTHDGGATAIITSLSDVNFTGSRSTISNIVPQLINALVKLGATDSTTA